MTSSFSLRAVTGPTDPDFAPAYAALAEEFEARGELERREVIEGWLSEARTYRLLVARTAEGAFAGVRDFHVITDPVARITVVYLAHVLVLPPFRRSGLAARLRSEPLVGISGGDVMVAAEMEPASLDEPPTLVRLVAYGREGFSAIDPSRLHYRQPDFRKLGAHDVPRPIPLLAIVRVVGREGATVIPIALARAFVRHLYAVFATHVNAAHLAALEAETLGPLEGLTELPLLPLPRRVDDAEAFAPLARQEIAG